MKLVTMPGANDVHVIVIKGLPEVAAVLANQVDHLRHAQAFTSRSALVRTEIAVRIVFSGMPYDPDLDRPDLDQTYAAVGNLAFLANKHFRHLFSILRFATASYDSASVSSALSPPIQFGHFEIFPPGNVRNLGERLAEWPCGID